MRLCYNIIEKEREDKKMKVNSKRYEEKRMVFNDNEKELMAKCSDFLEGLMEEITGVDLEGITLPTPGHDYGYTQYEFYNSLWEADSLLVNLLAAGSAIAHRHISTQMSREK
jgi:putative N-acetylmannosamine-6-phosphate epimerase